MPSNPTYARVHRDRLRSRYASLFLAIMLLLAGGCYSIQNGWLDPTVLGNFTTSATMEIRTSLTLEDTPPGIPGAVPPSPADLELVVEEYPISAGDTLTIEIEELRDRFVPFQAQVQVSHSGYINLPVVGRIKAVDLTVPEFEDAVAEVLRSREILKDPEVTINPLFLQKATYSIFGIGVSASNNAPLRAGTFPIRRPDVRVLEAINQVGGLNEFVTDVYIFRSSNHLQSHHVAKPDDRTSEGVTPSQPLQDSPGDESALDSEESALADLLEAVDRDEDEPPLEKPKVEDTLEPEQGSTYIWVDGEFVPNPAHGETPVDEEALPPPDALNQQITPARSAWSRLAGDLSYRVLRISADRLRDGIPDANIFVRAGDVIRIVSGEIGVYYVMGQVNQVGGFRFDAEQITLKAAIAAAGGLSDLAWPDRCTVYRRLGQREQMIQVNLDRIFAGQDPDFIVRRGDIINVGTHPAAPYLQRLRQLSLPTPTTTIGYGFTYLRNFADIDSFAVQANPNNQRANSFPSLFP